MNMFKNSTVKYIFCQAALGNGWSKFGGFMAVGSGYYMWCMRFILKMREREGEGRKREGEKERERKRECAKYKTQEDKNASLGIK